MLRHLSFIIPLFMICFAQDHLTCIRSDQTSRPPLTSTTVQQGPPGKRGPIGLKGDIGLKGSKGEPGIPDNSMFNQLRNEINQLRQQIERNIENIRLPYKFLGNGWATLYNGYQYKVTSNRQTWDESRSMCRRWGGDLVVQGFQNRTFISLLERALSISSSYWIGLNDKASEGNFVWLNGRRESSTSFLWHAGEPNNYRGSEDCAGFHSNNRAYDYSCNYNLKAVCEKRLSL